jgi:hypothetical protein
MLKQLDKSNTVYIKKNSLKVKCNVYKIINENIYGYKIICYKGKTLIQFNFYPSKTKHMPALTINQQVTVWFSIKHKMMSAEKVFNYFVINIIEPYISAPKTKTSPPEPNTPGTTLSAFTDENFE